MPPRSKSKRSSRTRTYETRSSEPKQKRLASPNRVTKRVMPKTPATIPRSKNKQDTLTQRGFDLSSSRSEDVNMDYSDDVGEAYEENIPRKRQKTMTQTLTQVGFVTRQEPDDLDLDYITEPKISYGKNPRSGKRKKPLPQQPLTRQTRSTRKRAAETSVQNTEIEGEEGKQQLKAEIDSDRTSRQYILEGSMLPPATPPLSRRREIPCSQSSADTPISSRSYWSARDISRSPLKEKSTNARRKVLSPGGAVTRLLIKEVADSMDHNKENDELPSGEQLTRLTNSMKSEESTLSTSVSQETHIANGNEESAPSQKQIREAEVDDSTLYTPSFPKTEVSDTDDDDEEASLVNEGENPIKPDTLSNSSNLARPPTESPHSQHRKPSTPILQTLQAKFPHSSSNPHMIIRHLSNSSSSPMDGPSTQLTQDLLTHTPTAPSSLPEREWQSENAGHGYIPSSLPSSPPHRLLPPRTTNHNPQNQNQNQNQKDKEKKKEKEKEKAPNPPSRSSTLEIQPKPLSLPPSQTSTVDITQPPSSASPSSPNFNSKVLLLPPPLSSSPPPYHPTTVPVLNPNGCNQAAEEIQEWDGVRLTDSQLLPDSIMNDEFDVWE